MPGRAALLGVGGAGASRRVKGETGKATAALPTAGVLSLLEWFFCVLFNREIEYDRIWIQSC